MSVFVVCEAGLTHYGDPELARRQIDAAVEGGADAVKFIVYETSEFVSRRVAAERREALGYDWYERHEERRLSWDALRDLHEHARERGIVFFASPRGPASLRFLIDELDVPLVKVGSGEASNYPFLEQVGATGRPVHIAFGLQTDEEAKRAVETLVGACAQ